LNDVRFGAQLLGHVLTDIRGVTTAAERNAAWVSPLDDGRWEFHGPRGFHWEGRAQNPYHARYRGWAAWGAQHGAELSVALVSLKSS